MAKRRAADRAKAVEDLSTRAYRTVTLSADPHHREKNLIQLAAERMAESRFTEMMASAGVGHDRMALEVLYWLPGDFLTLYQELYTRALSGTDGNTGARGKAAEQTGATGKAKGKALKGRKFKRYWVVQDEHVLQLKERVDKRLRAMTRDIQVELGELDASRGAGDKAKIGSGSTKVHDRCGECGIMLSNLWNYCPKCGCPNGIVAKFPK